MNSTTRPTLLVLAASLYQCETIRTAQRLGYRVVTTDNRPDNPGHRLADRAHHVDTTDRAGVLAVAVAEKIAGIIAPCTDVAMPAAALVAERLGLHGPGSTSTEIACDKVRFRAFLREHGFPVPEFCAGRAGAIATPPGRAPWIVKPAQASGSKGVIVIEDPTALGPAVAEACRFSKSGEAVIEEFIDGFQGTLEGWLRDGALEWCCFLDRETAPLPHTATHGHCVPTTLSPEQCALVTEVAARLWRSLGVADGPFDCDFVLRGRDTFILEVSPRLGGNSIGTLVRSACRIDLVERAVRWACGERLAPMGAAAPAPRAIALLGSDRPGHLRWNTDEAVILGREPWVRELHWDLAPGAFVQPFIDGRHRVGQALIAADDRATLDARVRELRARLGVTAT